MPLFAGDLTTDSSFFGTIGGTILLLLNLALAALAQWWARRGKKEAAAAKEAAETKADDLAEQMRKTAQDTIDAVMNSVGTANGKGPANRMLETIVSKVDDIALSQKLLSLAQQKTDLKVATLAQQVSTLQPPGA